MQTMPIGVVVERRRVDHPWQDHEWLPVDVVPGVDNVDEWKEIARGEGWVRYLVASLPLELHRKETEGYKVNLSNDPPMIYIVMNMCEDADAEYEIEATHVTASAYDAQDYLDPGESIVEGVPMPEGVAAWIQAFVTKHHVDEPFRKRKRKRYHPDKVEIGQPPEHLKRGRPRFDE